EKDAVAGHVERACRVRRQSDGLRLVDDDEHDDGRDRDDDDTDATLQEEPVAANPLALGLTVEAGLLACCFAPVLLAGIFARGAVSRCRHLAGPSLSLE